MNIESNSILHYNDEIDHKQILDYEFSDDSNIFSDTQESMSKQCIFKNKKQVWHSHPLVIQQKELPHRVFATTWNTPFC